MSSRRVKQWKDTITCTPSCFPEEILIRIMLFLPFRSILSWRFVSTQSMNLLREPYFFHRYHDQPLLMFEMENSLYCVLAENHGKNMDASGNVYGFPPFRVRHIKIDSRHHFDYEIFYGRMSCNGMICVKTDRGHFLFFNLFTGEFYSEENAPLGMYTSMTCATWTCFGFGYNRYEDDYKILVVCSYIAGKRYKLSGLWKNIVQSEQNDIIWIYSYRNHSWMILENVSFPYAAYIWPLRVKQGYFFNGVLHWIAKRSNNTDMVIVTYNFRTCNFGEMSMPVGNHFRLTELCGKLCCWNYHIVWLMNVYGVEESWTILFSVDLPNSQRKLPYIDSPVMVFERDDGERLVLFINVKFGTLRWYNIDKDEIRTIYRRFWQTERVIGERQRRKRASVTN